MVRDSAGPQGLQDPRPGGGVSRVDEGPPEPLPPRLCPFSRPQTLCPAAAPLAPRRPQLSPALHLRGGRPPWSLEHRPHICWAGGKVASRLASPSGQPSSCPALPSPCTTSTSLALKDSGAGCAQGPARGCVTVSLATAGWVKSNTQSKQNGLHTGGRGITPATEPPRRRAGVPAPSPEAAQRVSSEPPTPARGTSACIMAMHGCTRRVSLCSPQALTGGHQPGGAPRASHHSEETAQSPSLL